LKVAIDRLNLSLSEILSVLSVAKTIALMASKNEYGAEHIAEAISYKTK